MQKIIATVGPSLLNTVHLSNISSSKNVIFRINGAHGSVTEIEKTIEKIRNQLPYAEILMDLPGNKVRTKLDTPIKIQHGKSFTLGFNEANYVDFYRHLKVSDTVWANDSTFRFEVTRINLDTREIHLLSHSDGVLGNGKGMHVRGIHGDIPFLFDKDLELIELCNRHVLAFVGLSFVRNVDDVRLATKLLNSKTKIISKIETLAAVCNLHSILSEVEFILIDRGDLSTEVGLLNIGRYQEKIIRTALSASRKVFLATQFLKNMEHHPVPSIPEIIDLFNTLKQPIYGVQLSEETAVGKYPLECIDVIQDVMGQVEAIDEFSFK